MPKFCLLALSLLLFIHPGDCAAQGETTSAIAYQINDESGGAVPDAQVTVSNNETGLKRTVRTDKEGRFEFPQLMPGTYTVQVTAAGFQDQKNTSVAAALGRTQTVNFVETVKSIKQDITVTEDSTLINTENPNTATTLKAGWRLRTCRTRVGT